MIETASPLEIASMWRIEFLSANDVASVCLRWLEKDQDRGNLDIAMLAGASGLVLQNIAPAFERALLSVAGRRVERDEAILRALRLHLSNALKGNLIEGVEQILGWFIDLSEHRLVHNPRRVAERPHENVAEQELGLEYIYGCYHSFDDILHLRVDEQQAARKDLLQELRGYVLELKQHLDATIGT